MKRRPKYTYQNILSLHSIMVQNEPSFHRRGREGGMQFWNVYANPSNLKVEQIGLAGCIYVSAFFTLDILGPNFFDPKLTRLLYPLTVARLLSKVLYTSPHPEIHPIQSIPLNAPRFYIHPRWHFLVLYFTQDQSCKMSILLNRATLLNVNRNNFGT